jgi:HD-GYP domain-containing protein (c-di-GMP phosphodiesterase class II)
MQAADCEAADRLAVRLELGPRVRRGLADVWTRWDGHGQPALGGQDSALSARVALVANLAEMYVRLGGPSAAVEVVRRRRAAHLDPKVADAFLGAAERLLEPLRAESVWDLALEAEPPPHRRVPSARLDAVAAALGDFADLKSVFTLGHSAGVARLAEGAARTIGLAEGEVALCRRAGLVHDLGRVAVPTGIWEKRGRLTGGEWERVRLHPYYSERVLVRSDVLQPLAQISGMHHERRDGSGYHRGLGSAGLSIAARVLAVADTYHAMTEERPHRPARTPAEAARALEQGARDGSLDAEAVRAVLNAAGQPTSRRINWPAGLSDREVEVLRLVARGRTDKEIAQTLVISEVTVHHHVRHVYDKIGVSTRAGAALFAMEHDLIQHPSL